MKYYRINNSIDNKIVGIFPQSEECKFYGDIYNASYNNLLETLIKLPEPVLLKKAKVTNYITNSAINSNFLLILKNDFINFISDYDLANFKTWNIKVHYKNDVITDFSLFYLIANSAEKYINFSKSKFRLGKYSDFTYKGDEINIDNYNTYLKKNEELSLKGMWLREEKVFLDLSKSKEDIFRISDSPFSGYYISTKLKNAIEERGFTGMEFQEIGSIKNVEVLY